METPIKSFEEEMQEMDNKIKIDQVIMYRLWMGAAALLALSLGFLTFVILTILTK